jgi:hypothetical protein
MANKEELDRIAELDIEIAQLQATLRPLLSERQTIIDSMPGGGTEPGEEPPTPAKQPIALIAG